MTKPNQPHYVFQRNEKGDLIPRAAIGSNVVLELPPQVFSLQYDKDIGVYLQPEKEFRVPERVYGNVANNVDRFLRSFELNDKNLGVMLIGDQGTGKTLTLKQLGRKVNDMGMPVILINQQFSPAILMTFFSMVEQPCLICVDEVDKTFVNRSDSGSLNTDAQNVLLQLLDGTSTSTKKMFVFTANNEEAVIKQMKNRPSRVRYTVKFERMDRSALVDYVSSNLIDYADEHLRAFIHLALADGSASYGQEKSSDGLNFDTMREMVVEMNQFKCDLNEAASFMLDTQQTSWLRFEVTEFENGVSVGEKFSASGNSKGCYMGRDKFSCRVNALLDIEKPTVPGDGEILGAKFKADSILLSEADFVRFGDELDVLVFARGGREYHLRYTSYGNYHSLENAMSIKTQSRRGVDSRSRSVLAGDVAASDIIDATAAAERAVVFPDPEQQPV